MERYSRTGCCFAAVILGGFAGLYWLLHRDIRRLETTWNNRYAHDQEKWKRNWEKHDELRDRVSRIEGEMHAN